MVKTIPFLGIAVALGCATLLNPESYSFTDKDPLEPKNDNRYTGDVLVRMADYFLHRHPNTKKLTFTSNLYWYRRQIVFKGEGQKFGRWNRDCFATASVDERDPKRTFELLWDCKCPTGKLSAGGATVVEALKGIDRELMWRPQVWIEVPKTKGGKVVISEPEWPIGELMLFEGRWIFFNTAYLE